MRNLAAFNGVVILLLVGYAYFLQLPLAQIVPLVLTAVLASIPVALPATFTLAAALGARVLARQGVLPTRLTAVDEAGTTNVLCVDKTGTLTQNSLTVTSVQPLHGLDESHVLALAALASSDGGQDPVDGAIRSAAAAKAAADAPKLITLVLFLIAGRVMTGQAILTPLLMIIVMVAGDFLAMSLTTDNVRPSPTPNEWRIGRLTMAGVSMGLCLLIFCTGMLAVGKYGLNPEIDALRTLAFIVLVFGGQASIYAIRERRHLWGTPPSLPLGNKPSSRPRHKERCEDQSQRLSRARRR